VRTLPSFLSACLPAYLPSCLPASLTSCLPACLSAFLLPQKHSLTFLPSVLLSFLPSPEHTLTYFPSARPPARTSVLLFSSFPPPPSLLPFLPSIRPLFFQVRIRIRLAQSRHLCHLPSPRPCFPRHPRRRRHFSQVTLASISAF
jgi:hypothetical protein